jgi:hypothetical protein
MYGRGVYWADRVKLSSLKIRIFTVPIMKKVVFLLAFILLTVANQRLAADEVRPEVREKPAIHETCGGPEMPMGEGEEQSGSEEDKSISEDDEDPGIGHRWLSREKSSSTDLHILYQENLFKSLVKKIVIPPPRA